MTRYEELEKIQKQIVPQTGAFEGWKKLRHGMIAHLRITPKAKRIGGSDAGHRRKCRASRALVLAIYNRLGRKVEEGYSIHNPNFVYKPGKIVRPNAKFDEREIACTSGIHFYLSRIEAENH